MEHIPQFYSLYDMFSGKFQSTHFVHFRNVRLRRGYSNDQIFSLILREIVSPDILMPRFTLALLEKTVAVANRCFFFYSLPIYLSSLEVVFLELPSGFLASHDQVSSSFLEIQWITLLDFFIVCEISTSESVSSLRNLTISFLSSNYVRLFRHVYTSLCNFVKYPILYSYPQIFLMYKMINNFTDLFNRSNVLIIYFFRMLYNYSYNFIQISLLRFIFYN